MSRATAMAEAKKLKAIMAKHGVRCSIELQVGRPYAAGDDWFTRKHVLINHHTAGSKTGNTPSLALVKRGRGEDLPGPLCNGYGGRDHIYRITTMGLANHPGLGGPISLAGFTVPLNSARISTWGTEWEHDGVSRWPEEMREFMGRSNAALLEYLGAPVARSIEHSTWAPRRKIDRNGYTAATGQAEIRAWAGQGPTTHTDQEDDGMATITPDQFGELIGKTQVKLTKAAAEQMSRLGSPRKENEEISLSYLLQWGGAGAYRELAELRAYNKAVSGQLATLTKAVQQLAAGSPTGVKAAFDEGIARLQAEVQSIDISVTTGDSPEPAKPLQP